MNYFFFVLCIFWSILYLCNDMNDIDFWIKNEQRDYKEGVSLLEKYCGNAHLVRYFANMPARFAMKDLIAELRRVHVPDSDMKVVAVPTKAAQPSIPPVVAKAKKMVHDYWVALSKIHLQLFDIGEGNGDEDVKARRRLMEKREPLIERYNSIYEAKEAFFAGSLPESQLQDVVSGKSLQQVIAPESAKEVIPLQSLTDLQLAKKAKAAKAAINRCKNQLRYQQDTAAKVENPMAQCPRRKKIEERLQERENELAILEAELNKRM